MKLNRFFIEYRVLRYLEIFFGPSLKESKAFTDSFDSPYPSGELSINRVEQELEKKHKSKEERKQALENLQEVVASGYWSFLIRQELHSLK